MRPILGDPAGSDRRSIAAGGWSVLLLWGLDGLVETGPAGIDQRPGRRRVSPEQFPGRAGVGVRGGVSDAVLDPPRGRGRGRYAEPARCFGPDDVGWSDERLR